MNLSTKNLTVSDERKVFSQNGEDGILAAIFRTIGDGAATFVEVGCEDGRECNTRLLRESGWKGWMFDACHENATINLHRTFVTVDNVRALFTRYGVPLSFDLLSLDIDFNDFHVLNEILQEYRPRVIVVEYNAGLGPDEDAVVPHLPEQVWDGTNWFGASATAMRNLAAHHDYRVVYADSQGVNLFLVDEHRVESAQLASTFQWMAPRYGAQCTGHPEDVLERPFLRSEHYLSVAAKVARTRYGVINYLAGDEYIGREFQVGRYWDEGIIQQVAQHIGLRGGWAVDVGAHIGSHSVALARLRPDLRFLCFEPQPGLRLLLERNVAENLLHQQIVVSKHAVSYASGTGRMAATFSDGASAGQPVSYSGTTGNFGGVQLGVDGERVDMVSLDSIRDIDVAYLKVDVEGAESLVFYGARELILQSRPFILYEQRGDRTLSASVLDEMGVPDLVRRFDPTEWLIQQAGYDVLKLGLDYLALPKAAWNSEPPQAVAWHAGAAIEPDDRLGYTAATPTGLPPILFQTWKTRRNLPPHFHVWRNTFLSENVGFAFPLWDDADNRLFVEKNFPWFLEVYDGYPQEIYRADAVRYLFLYAYGGVYADLDVQCLRSLDTLIGGEGVFLGRMGGDPDFEHAVPNAIMASSPRHPFWLLVIAHIAEAARQNESALRPEYMTGPVILKRSVDFLRNHSDQAKDVIREMARLLPTHLQPRDATDVHLLPSCHWYPLDWSDKIHQAFRQELIASGAYPDVTQGRELFPKAQMVTYWSHSWE